MLKSVLCSFCSIRCGTPHGQKYQYGNI